MLRQLLDMFVALVLAILIVAILLTCSFILAQAL